MGGQAYLTYRGIGMTASAHSSDFKGSRSLQARNKLNGECFENGYGDEARGRRG